MARPCSICTHAKRAAIERMTESANEVARRYPPLSPDAVQRHRKFHVSRKSGWEYQDDTEVLTSELDEGL
jgi:hypothetical protein